MLTGASEFPNLHEADVAVLKCDAGRAAALRRAEISASRRSPPIRLAAAVRALARQFRRSAQGAAARGQRCSSPISARAADFTARAAFAKSFFETGGIEAVDSEGFADPAALAAAFKASGAALACLCSVGQGLCRHAEAAAPRPCKPPAQRHIYLAGRPGELEAALRDAGVSDFIFAGGDALATLQDAWQRME